MFDPRLTLFGNNGYTTWNLFYQLTLPLCLLTSILSCNCCVRPDSVDLQKFLTRFSDGKLKEHLNVNPYWGLWEDNRRYLPAGNAQNPGLYFMNIPLNRCCRPPLSPEEAREVVGSQDKKSCRQANGLNLAPNRI